MGVVVDMTGLSLGVECDQRHLTVCDDPDAPKGIVIAADGREDQQLLQFWVDRRHGFHRLQVDDVDALVEGHPESLEIVLGNTSARLAVQIEPRLHDTITVVAHQTATIGGDPEEAVGVFANVADMVMGQAVAQIQRRQVIPFCQEVAGKDGRWRQKKIKEEKGR